MNGYARRIDAAIANGELPANDQPLDGFVAAVPTLVTPGPCTTRGNGGAPAPALPSLPSRRAGAAGAEGAESLERLEEAEGADVATATDDARGAPRALFASKPNLEVWVLDTLETNGECTIRDLQAALHEYGARAKVDAAQWARQIAPILKKMKGHRSSPATVVSRKVGNGKGASFKVHHEVLYRLSDWARAKRRRGRKAQRRKADGEDGRAPIPDRKVRRGRTVNVYGFPCLADARDA